MCAASRVFFGKNLVFSLVMSQKCANEVGSRVGTVLFRVLALRGSRVFQKLCEKPGRALTFTLDVNRRLFEKELLLYCLVAAVNFRCSRLGFLVLFAFWCKLYVSAENCR